MTEKLEDPEIDGKIILKNSEYRKGYVARSHSVERGDGSRISRGRLNSPFY
jgi:hypothetical protein